MKKIRLAYFASGGGSSVEQLARRINDGALEGYESVLIICNRPFGHAKAGIYDRAAALDIPTFHAPDAQRQLELLDEHLIDVIVCMGYVAMVEKPVLDRYKDCVLNIHPTLLPLYGGPGMYDLRTHMAVLAAGDTHTGVTIHLMDEEYDKGKILLQLKFPLPDDLVGKPPTEENAKALQQFVLRQEHRLMPTALAWIINGWLKIGLHISKYLSHE